MPGKGAANLSIQKLPVDQQKALDTLIDAVLSKSEGSLNELRTKEANDFCLTARIETSDKLIMAQRASEARRVGSINHIWFHAIYLAHEDLSKLNPSDSVLLNVNISISISTSISISVGVSITIWFPLRPSHM